MMQSTMRLSTVRLSALAMTAALLCAPLAAQDEPPLPEGLGKKKQEEPALPEGLGGEKQDEPTLPEGLDEKKEPATEAAPESGGFPASLPFDLNGFVEGRAGYRTRPDPHEKDMSIGEARLQLELAKQWTGAALHLTADFLYDHVTDRHDARIESGEGWLDLREANIVFSPLAFMDVKAGRQVLTWGTGDLLFINDLFPKDWNSFFSGRDTEYLKAPSDAVKGSFFSNIANLDVAYTPRFDPDRFIDGERISYWNGSLGRLAGRDAVVRADVPENWVDDGEIAVRLYRNIEGYEAAVYGYRGFWKSPGGMDAATGRAVFPDLSVLGASLRGNVAAGIGNVEVGYYLSEDDSGGSDPLVRNSELRFLAGYEQELLTDFTAGCQYYLERLMDYGEYRRSLPAGAPDTDDLRHVITMRLPRLLLDQNLKLSLFTYFSPSDDDAYLRPSVNYKVSDDWALEMGGNVFAGKDAHTFFGQFEKNSNVYLSARYSF